MELRFDIATPGDDQSIRQLLSGTPMPGRATLTFEREPNYFMGCATMGQFCQVLVARDALDQKVIAMACRTARQVFINGKAEEVGYLGQLRVERKRRGQWLISRGFRFLRELHADGRVAVYLAAITEENRAAQGLLVAHPRRHFPAFREVSRMRTMSLVLRGAKATMRKPGYEICQGKYEICQGKEEDLDDIIAFLNRHGAQKQFFPVYTREDFSNSPATLGFDARDFIIARRLGQMAGVIGVWDQSAFKQTVVQDYSTSLRAIKPFYNFSARLAGAQPLPAIGERIRYAYASFICMENNDTEVFSLLLSEACNLAAQRANAYLMIGLCAEDPLLGVARKYAHISYNSKLYAVCWGDRGDFYERLDDRIPYVEIAAL